MLVIVSLAAPVALATGLGDAERDPDQGTETPVPVPGPSSTLADLVGTLPAGTGDGSDPAGPPAPGPGDGGFEPDPTPVPCFSAVHGVVEGCEAPATPDPADPDASADELPGEEQDAEVHIHDAPDQTDIEAGGQAATELVTDEAEGLVGAIGNLLQPVQDAALGATGAAKVILADVVVKTHFIVGQATDYAENRVSYAVVFVQMAIDDMSRFLGDALPGTGVLTGTYSSETPTPQSTETGASPEAIQATTLALGAVGGFGLLLAGFAALRKLLSFGGATLLSRIPSKDIMKNDTRAGIFDIVQTDPGVSLNEIVTRLGISRNAVAYHLAVFESEKTVVSVKDGKYRRYFVNGGKYVNGAKDVVAAIKNDVTLNVIRFIMEHPGVMQKEVCQAVGTSPSATNWHINRLEKVGLVAKEKVANTVRYTPGPSVQKYDLVEFGLGAERSSTPTPPTVPDVSILPVASS